MKNKDFVFCCTCDYSWRRGQDGSHSCSEFLKKQLEVTDQLLDERQRVLDAIPECPRHGSCVPHALEWIEKSQDCPGHITQ